MPITSRHIHLSIAFISLAVILGFIILYIWDPDYEFFPNHLPTHPIVIGNLELRYFYLIIVDN